MPPTQPWYLVQNGGATESDLSPTSSLSSQVRYVSDFFKHRPPRQCDEKDPERKPSLPLTLSDTDRNHYSYAGAP